MTPEKCLDILKKYTTKPNLIGHAVAVSATMKHFAKLEGEDENYWACIGMLHDIDFEQFPEQHCYKCVELLKTEGFDDNFIKSIQSHGFEICTEVEPKLYMEKVLSAVDQLTGLIRACALIQPEKKLDVVEISSVKRKWDNKEFAKGTNRERILRVAARMGKTLDYLIEQTLIALKPIANEIGV